MTSAATVETLQQRAAVLGIFDPVGLAGGQAKEEKTRRALAELARNCREIALNGKVGWLLNPDLRRETLSQLSPSDAKRLLREAAGARHKADRFGEFLGRSLRGSKVSTSKLSVDELESLHAALQFAGEVREGRRDDARAVRRTLARKDSFESLRVAAPPQLIGRDEEYKALLQFNREGTVPEEYAGSLPDSPVFHDPDSSVRVLVVSGVGGVGKSALLATFAYKTRRFSGNAPLILLDFDRPSVGAGDPVQLTLEFTRQLGLEMPRIDTRLAEIRSFIREHAAAQSDNEASSFEGGQRRLDSAYSLLNSTVVKAGLSDKPLLLLLDTFEEILVRGRESTEFVFRWLDGLKNLAGFRGIRVVVSGRAGPETVMGEDRILGHIELDDLSQKAAVEFLKGREVPSERAMRAAAAFGGNPLVLSIFERYCRGKTSEEVESLLKEGDQRGELAKVMSQRFLYTRILDRIHDKKVRMLAHPGLVLRRVTPDLIFRVLAEPCELKIPSVEEARGLFENLKQHVWLIDCARTDEVRHRRDLRRLMLPQIMENQTEKAIRIHKAARDYYKADSDKTLSASEQMIENKYHSAFVNGVDDLLIDDAPRLLSALGSDLDDLPPAVRGFLKLHGDEGATLSDEERLALDGSNRQEADRRHQRELLRTGSGAEARSFSNETTLDVTTEGWVVGAYTVQGMGAAAAHITEPPSSEEIEAAFSTCDFRYLSDAAAAVFATFPQFIDKRRKELAKRGFLYSDFWRCALAVRVQQRVEQVKEQSDPWLATRELAERLGPWNPGDSVREYAVEILPVTLQHLAGETNGAAALVNALDQLRNEIADAYTWLKDRIRTPEAFRFLRLAGGVPGLPVRFPSELDVEATLYRNYTRNLADVAMSENLPVWKLRSKSGWRSVFRKLLAEQDAGDVSGQRKAVSADLSILDELTTGMTDNWRTETPSAPKAGLPSGYLPELHAPIRHALARVIEEGGDLSPVVEQLEQQALFWPDELAPHQFERSRQIATHKLPSLTEISDRCNLLGSLLGSLEVDYGEIRELRETHKLLLSYEDLLNQDKPLNLDPLTQAWISDGGSSNARGQASG